MNIHNRDSLRRSCAADGRAAVPPGDRTSGTLVSLRAGLCALSILAALLLSGCATSAMKGTPFYTGEYERRLGPVEERVNVWPLFYYREPALSFLWPIGEWTDGDFMLRPIFGVHGLDKPHRTYDVLWPLAYFDPGEGRHRIFPFFWGPRYAVGFPLYWHGGRPLDPQGKGHDALWPLWIWRHDREQWSFHLAWPFLNAKSYAHDRGGRVWPLYGRYVNPASGSGSAFWLWPLGRHAWTKDSESWWTLPLAVRETGPSESSFHTLLFGWERKGAERSWHSLPLLGWGRSDGESASANVLAGLAGWSRGPERHEERLLPLFYERTRGDESLFLSVPWSQGREAGGEWSLAPPLYWHHREGPRELTLAFPLLWGSDREVGRRWWAAVPLAYRRMDDDGGRAFVSPLGGWWRGADRRTWAVYPLLSGGQRRPDGGELWLAGPLGHVDWDREGTSHWLLPLYLWDHRDRLFVSPLWNSWRNDDGGGYGLSPPLLSLYRTATNRWDLWSLAGLFHASGGSEGGSSHLFPLYYYDRDTWLTPLCGAWENAGTRFRYLLTPLAGVRSGATHGGWFEPFFEYGVDPVRDRLTGSFLLAGEFRRSPSDAGSSFPLLYDYDRWDRGAAAARPPAGTPVARGWSFGCLLGSMRHEVRWQTRIDGQTRPASNGVWVARRTDACYPLLSWGRRETGIGRDVSFASRHVLLLLCDSLREHTGATAAEPAHDYTRQRVLYRLFHRETLNGAVSVDAFPAVTYDRDPARRLCKVSFLWRVFRYERSDRGCAVDLLCVPVWRSRGRAP
jgi:hypothetical protein